MTEDAWASASRRQHMSNSAFYGKSETLKDQQRPLIAPSVYDIESKGDSTSTDNQPSTAQFCRASSYLQLCCAGSSPRFGTGAGDGDDQTQPLVRASGETMTDVEEEECKPCATIIAFPFMLIGIILYPLVSRPSTTLAPVELRLCQGWLFYLLEKICCCMPCACCVSCLASVGDCFIQLPCNIHECFKSIICC